MPSGFLWKKQKISKFLDMTSKNHIINDERLIASFQPAYFLDQISYYYPDYYSRKKDLSYLVARYFADARLRRISPNAMFDEHWYRAKYADVAGAIAAGHLPSGFVHFIEFGYHEGRSPNADWHARVVRNDYVHPEISEDDFSNIHNVVLTPEEIEFMSNFPWIKPYNFFIKYGRFIFKKPYFNDKVKTFLFKEFDSKYYRNMYLDGNVLLNDAEVFEYYFSNGLKLHHSPNAQFSEEWYLAIYSDVRDAVGGGGLPCGFYHYLVAGRAEGRQPVYTLAGALEIALPGVTVPELQHHIPDLEKRLKPIDAIAADTAVKTLWVLLPYLNPDISFGGYRAFFEFIGALKPYLAARDTKIRIITIAEHRSSKPYFLWRMQGKPEFGLFEDIVVQSRHECGQLAIGRADRVLTYSTWDALVGTHLAALTDDPRIIGFHQEYEPIFHSYGAHYALAASAFDLPCYPVFNSAELHDFFQKNRLSIFKANPGARENRDYARFDHIINVLPNASAPELAGRSERVCAIYARPEGHAARNLYEFVEIALRRLCTAGRFAANWRFVGLGCLTPLPPVNLGGGHQLKFVQKMPEEDYVRFVRGLDLGISLMYAPHPSVVPFEFATTGALVVTNVFENRPADYFQALSANFIACEPTIDAVAGAIEAALARVEDFEARVAAAYRPERRTWADVFGPAFLDRTIGQLFKADPAVPGHIRP